MVEEIQSLIRIDLFAIKYLTVFKEVITSKPNSNLFFRKR